MRQKTVKALPDLADGLDDGGKQRHEADTLVAGMVELYENLCIVCVESFCKFFERLDMPVIGH